MGIRVDAFTNCSLPDSRPHSMMFDLLRPTLPSALAVQSYWNSVDSTSEHHQEEWCVGGYHPDPELDHLHYKGPGSLWVYFGPRVARINASCRWSGFTTIDPLQKVHAVAFRSIAKALRGTHLIIVPENDLINDLVTYDQKTLEQAMDWLYENWGPPRPVTTTMSDREFYATRKPIWFSESLT
jgi:hypothetical protein